MSGILKHCNLCGKDFVTRTLKSASWQRYCDECYTTKKLTAYQQTSVTNANNQNNQMLKDIEMIKTQFKTVLLISHLDSLKDCADLTIDIQKQNGYARVNL